MAERPQVLYIDDQKEITDLMTMALGSEGFDVTAANDGQAAIEALSANPKIDAIVLDYMMPNLDGLQFLERVSQTRGLHTIKVILCSGALPDQQDEVDPIVWTKFWPFLDGGAGCPGGGPKAAVHSGLESALGSHPCVALSSYQASPLYGSR